MNYKERLDCNEYIPLCVINELERLNREIERLSREVLQLKRDKVSRTLIVPERDNSCPDDPIIPDGTAVSSGNVPDQENLTGKIQHNHIKQNMKNSIMKEGIRNDSPGFKDIISYILWKNKPLQNPFRRQVKKKPDGTKQEE